ncbi:MAG: recombinase family protein [Polyangia bacterium]
MATYTEPHITQRTLPGAREGEDATLRGNKVARRAVGYIRVSTDMQAVDGLSLEAQQAAIESYCAAHGLTLVRLCRDVISGAKDQRPGLQDAFSCLQRSADVLVVLKFDRLSRSIKHFCEVYEQ